MTTGKAMDWRRWIAMLCIALMAVFAFDASDAFASCANPECSAACDIGACDDQDTDGAPCDQHHCCHGTVASQPAGSEVALSNVAHMSAPTLRDARVVSRAPDGLERPPRGITLG